MQQWNINFGPGFISPEEIERQHQQQLDSLHQMIDEKKCMMCKNTYLINDQITMCNYSKECVDGNYGEYCEHWDPLEIII